MYTKDELLCGIYEIIQGKHTIQNCEKLAAIYTVMDHLYPTDTIEGVSKDSEPVVIAEQPHIGNYGDTDFLRAIKGKNPYDMWQLMDELMQTLLVINPRLYDSVMRKV